MMARIMASEESLDLLFLVLKTLVSDNLDRERRSSDVR